MKTFIHLLSILVLSLTSCSLNKMFLRPQKIPVTDKKLQIASEKDTIYAQFSQPTHQPLFFDKNNDTIHLNFILKSVVFKSESGNELNGWLLTPKDKTPTVTLLHFHGNAGNLISQYGAISELTKHGFQLFLFDYSGFGFSTGKATRKNVLKEGNSAVTFVSNMPETQNTKLLIYGQSLGGHLGAVVAAANQDFINGLIIEGAFSSHKDIAKEVAGGFGKLFVKELYAAKQSVKEFHKPVLVIHSSEDAIIPIKLGQRIFDNANEPKEFYEIRGYHICGPRLYTDSIAAKITLLLSK